MDDEIIMVPVGWSTTIPVQLDLPLVFAPMDGYFIPVPPGETPTISVPADDNVAPVRGRP
jgi:hypothetical protein